MQNRYTGDIGDFGKYGLLRALCGEDLSLGVVWYLYPDGKGNGDGSHIGYLWPEAKNSNELRTCDPPLYDALGDLVCGGNRSVAAVRERGVLPAGTTFYEEPLSFSEMPWRGPKTEQARLGHREEWLQGALSQIQDCDVVFADPDNGLEAKSVKLHEKEGPKYAFTDELEPYVDRGQSLVVYHSPHYGAPVKEQICERLAMVRESLGPALALRYHRGSARVFFVLPSGKHAECIGKRARQFAEDPCWSQHFTLYE